MKAVIFGAGSVGRGFLGELFSESNMNVCFIDIDEKIINSINSENRYPHITVYNSKENIKWIENVYAISSNDKQSVINEILNADIIATSVGIRVLPLIAPMISEALVTRLDLTGKPINILLCENLNNIDGYMRNLLVKDLDTEKAILLEKKVGLLSTSIGRMIPVSSEATKSIHPMAIKVEPYKLLPYDGLSVKGIMPNVTGLIWDKNVDFDYYSERKLYIHNLGHCMIAYFAEIFGYKYIEEAVMNPEVRYIVRSAMIESAMALSKKYRYPINKIIKHIDNLLMRFGNKSLMDTCERVGRDPARKLKSDDRFLGALKVCIEQNISSRHVSLGVALGLLKLSKSDDFICDSIESYLRTEAAFLFKDNNSNNLKLLKEQIITLQKGYSYGKIINIFDKYSPKDIA